MQSMDFFFENECSTKNQPHHGKRIISYNLKFMSHPWILLLPLKQVKHCNQISDLESELQVMNIKFVHAAIIRGDGTHFVGVW